MGDLRDAMRRLPDNIQKRVARQWTRHWAERAWIATIQQAPIGKTRNLVKGIVRRNSTKKTLTRLKSFSRSVVIGKKPAHHFHLVVAGTRPRYTTGYGRANSRASFRSALGRAKQGLGIFKPAFRGTMPKNPFVAKAASSLMGPAEADLRIRVQRSLKSFLKKSAASGGGEA